MSIAFWSGGRGRRGGVVSANHELRRNTHLLQEITQRVPTNPGITQGLLLRQGQTTNFRRRVLRNLPIQQTLRQMLKRRRSRQPTSKSTQQPRSPHIKQQLSVSRPTQRRRTTQVLNRLRKPQHPWPLQHTNPFLPHLFLLQGSRTIQQHTVMLRASQLNQS